MKYQEIRMNYYTMKQEKTNRTNQNQSYGEMRTVKHEAQKHRLWQETRRTNYGKGKARMYTDLDYERDHTLNYELWLWQSKARQQNS